ncbi:MAG: DNRLRE domain-containing protein [Pseudomonadota bacterium]
MSSNKDSNKLAIEELEPRILFSADPIAAAAPASITENRLDLGNEDLAGLGLASQQPLVNDGSSFSIQPVKQFASQNITTTLLASKDTYITENNTSANYGLAGQIQIDISGGADLGKERILAQFDLSGIPANATITSATLLMNATTHTGGNTVAVNVHTVNTDWDEGLQTSGSDAANWIQARGGTGWTSSGGDYDATAVASATLIGAGVHSWDLTATVADWVNGSLQNEGVIIGSPQTGTDVFTFHSAEGSATLGPRLELRYSVPNTPPVATQLSTSETFTEDTPLDLSDIVVSDADDITTTATLTLSDVAAGALSTGTSGSVTSSYDPMTGEWQASGAISDVNALLAAVVFTPSADYDSNFTIVTEVSDGIAAPVTGTKNVTAIPVNDAPSATEMDTDQLYVEDLDAALFDIVVTDVDDSTITAILSLSDATAGLLTTGTAGSVTSTYDPVTGVWQAAGAIGDVNTLLADVFFTPSTHYNSNFAISTFVSDGVNIINGSKLMFGAAVNDTPTASNINATQTFTEDTPLNLSDIVVQDVDDTTTTATLTLSDVAAGELSTATSGSVTSTYDPGTGKWQASGDISDVNALLADLVFTPSENYDRNITIATEVRDDDSAGVAGSKTLNVIAVNDAPVITTLGGDVLIAQNDGTAHRLDTDSPAALTDVDAPLNYLGALLDVTGQGFDSNDLLGIDTSTGISLSAGISDGSAVSIGGLSVATLLGTSQSGFQISFGANATMGHTEQLLSALTFATNSTTLGQRTVDISFTDDGGTSNGGFDTSATQTVTVYVADANAARVTALEDTAYTFSSSDFDYTGITGSHLESITLLGLPPASGAGAGTLLVNGVPATVGQVVSKSEIDSDHFTFVPATNANGSPYAAFEFQVNNGKLNVNVLSGHPASNSLLGSAWLHTDELLQDANNFGLGGLYSSSLSIIANSATIDSTYLAQGSIFVDGLILDDQWSSSELTALSTWVNNGGIAIVSADSTDRDDVVQSFGLALGGNSGPSWQINNTTHPIVNGSFGLVGPFGGPIATLGSNYEYFDPGSLLPGDTVLATSLAGSSEPTIVLRPVGSGWLLAFGDSGIFRSENISGGGVISTPNDRLLGNIFAWAVDQLPSTDSYTLGIDIVPVNDAPEMANYSLTIAEGESLQLSASDISATDVDNSSSALLFSVSNVVGGQFELLSNPGVAISSFSPAQISAGDVVFVHNGDESAPEFDVSVSDGLLSSSNVAVNIDYLPVNDPPVIAGFGGSATVVANDGGANLLVADANVTIGNPELPADYDGAVLQIAGNNFGANDALGLDESGNITLSSGLNTGSEISVDGTKVAAISAGSSVSLSIVFNGDSNAQHIEQLLNSISFASKSIDIGPRSVTINFKDGGGTINGGNDASTPQTAFVYLRSADTGLVVGDEDTTYTFTASDFYFTGVTGAGIQFIRVTALPANGELTLSGTTVVADQLIGRSEIDAGHLQYLPEPDANGSVLTSLSLQINNGVLSANILAGKPAGSTLLGSRWFETTELILDADNFGPEGRYTSSLSPIAHGTTIDADYLAQGGILVDGGVRDSAWSAVELDALSTWVNNGGVLIATADDFNQDAIANEFGLTLGGQTAPTWQIADAEHPIMAGPFGTVGRIGESIANRGNLQAYFDPASLLPDDLVLATGSSGSSQPTMVLRAIGSGWVLFAGDEGIFRGDLSGGGLISTANDRLVGNIFAWAVDQLPTDADHSLDITLNPVNDGPIATGMNTSVAYTEDTPVDLPTLFISDIDSTGAQVTLALSTPDAGFLTTETVGAVGSNFDESTGVWSADGSISSLNKLLENLQFLPAPNVNGDVDITVSVTDGMAAPITGVISMRGTAVNDLPEGTVTVSNVDPIEEDIVFALNTVTDKDGITNEFSHQWLRDGVAIEGATASSYTLAAQDIGAELSVVVGYTDDDGALESVTSDATNAVLKKNRPATVSLSETSISLTEYPVSPDRIRLADISIADDGLGENTLRLSGPDAVLFEIDDGVLYLKANVQLDFETAARLEVFVEVDDPELSGEPNDSKTFEILVRDFDETSIVSIQANDAASHADGGTSERQQEREKEKQAEEEKEKEEERQKEKEKTEESSDDESTSGSLSVARTITEREERGELAGATRNLETNAATEQSGSAFLVSGIRTNELSLAAGLAEGTQGASNQVLDLDQLLALDSPDLFVDPLSSLGEFVTVDPMEGFSLLDNTRFQHGLDDMRRQVLSEDMQDKIVIGSTVSVTTGVSIGYVLWLIRGSVLLSTVLSSLPAWRLIDPLPVISGMLNNEDEDTESLESIIEDGETEPDVPTDNNEESQDSS